MSRLHRPAVTGTRRTVPSPPAGAAEVVRAHRAAGRPFHAAGVRSFVREQGTGPAGCAFTA